MTGIDLPRAAAIAFARDIHGTMVRQGTPAWRRLGSLANAKLIRIELIDRDAAQSKQLARVWAIGDAAPPDAPTRKATSQ